MKHKSTLALASFRIATLLFLVFLSIGSLLVERKRNSEILKSVMTKIFKSEIETVGTEDNQQYIIRNDPNLDIKNTSDVADKQHLGRSTDSEQQDQQFHQNSDGGGRSSHTVDYDGFQRDALEKALARIVADEIQRDKNISSSNAFDYDGFWRDALEKALAGLAAPATITDSSNHHNDNAAQPCPRVYMYNLSDSLRDCHPNPSLNETYGPDLGMGMGGRLRKTNQFGLARILEHKLGTNSKSPCRTDDPGQADLFFVPILTKPKGHSEWKEMCPKVSLDTILKELPHLNDSNACRHFFVVSKGHYVAFNCAGWFRDPVPRFQNFMRVAYSHVARGENKSEWRISDITEARSAQLAKSYPNLVSVPYPSNYHWKNTSNSNSTDDLTDMISPPWTTFDGRKHLMTFLGKHNHGDVPVRERIVEMCRGYRNDTICPHNTKFKHDRLPSKGNSVFCLEPAGDSPWRRSLSDSIAFGCIPVLFSEITDAVAPFSWGDWKTRGRVIVPRDEFLSGKIDLHELLSGIPDELLKVMQDTLSRYGKRFQYSLDDYDEDAVWATLQGLHNHATHRERDGLCG